jgi:hypothetical protein
MSTSLTDVYSPHPGSSRGHGVSGSRLTRPKGQEEPLKMTERSALTSGRMSDLSERSDARAKTARAGPTNRQGRPSTVAPPDAGPPGAVEDPGRTTRAGEAGSSDELLRASLERLVLLECRATGQLAPDSGLELELARWRHQAQAAESRASTAEAQRDRLFSQIMEAERYRSGLDRETGGVELASFIAELRSELSRVQEARDLAERQRAELLDRLQHSRRPTGAAPENPRELAEELIASGILKTAELTLTARAADLVAGSESERALLRAVLRDLDEGSTGLRLAALERLAGIRPRLAAPVYAAALTREVEPEVLAHLCRVAGRCGVRSLLPLLSRHAVHPDERVRVAVLFAQRRLNGEAGAEVPSMTGARNDDASHVRRAALLADTMFHPEELAPRLRQLAADPDPGFRRLLAACAAALAPPAEEVLQVLAQDRDGPVRTSALRALGAPVDLSQAPRAERRRALRHLPRKLHHTPVEVARPMPPRDVVAAIERELRQSLRGLTPDALLESLALSRAELNSALDSAISGGRIVRRGPRYFAS